MNALLDKLRRFSPGHLIYNPRTIILAVILAMAVTTGILAKAASEDRGLTEDAIWLIEASQQRATYYEGWLESDDFNPSDRQLIFNSFAPHGALPPLMPAVVASAKTVGGVKAPPSQVAATTNAIFLALLVLLLGVVGLEVGGSVGGLTAAIAAATVPRIFGLGSMSGLGMAALFMLTLAPIMMVRAHRSGLAAGGAALAIAGAIHTSLVGLFAWVPWLWFATTRPRQPRFSDGYTATPPVPIRVVVALVIGLALGFWAYPYTWFDAKNSLNIWLTHFLRQPSEPFLFGGVTWGHSRIPWYSGAYLVVATTPPAWIFLALAGLRFGGFYERLCAWRPLSFMQYLPWAPEPLRPCRISSSDPVQPGPQRQDMLRLAKICLLIALFLPLLFRTPYLGGIDLVAMSIPWVIILAAAGMARLVGIAVESVPWERALGTKGKGPLGALVPALALTLFVMALVVPPIIDVVRYHPLQEAYYSWIIGGPEGARDKGLPRYPNGPMPLSFIRELTAQQEGPVSVGFMLHHREYEEALNRAVGEGRVADVQVRNSVFDADVAVLPHNDLDPGYEAAVTDFYRTVNNEPDYPVIIFSRDSVPIFSATFVPRR